VQKALNPQTIESGVIEKIAAMASREHGDARKAIALLAKSAYLAEKAGSGITLTLVDEAATELDRDRYLTLVHSAPPQLQAAMAGIIEATQRTKNGSIGTGEAYDAYRRFCRRVELRPLTGRAFGDIVSELDIYSLLRSRVLSRGRYGRTREIVLDLPQELTEKIHGRILLSFGIQSQ
jgi:cell division control protein 6